MAIFGSLARLTREPPFGAPPRRCTLPIAMSEITDDACQHPPGTFVPHIDTALCEGKAVCAAVCPYGVFDIRKLTGPERRALTLLTRLKLVAHGGKQAFATRADDCRACGHCVDSCPEDAIKLIPAG